MGWMQYLLPIAFLGLIVWAHYMLFIGDDRKMADCSDLKVFVEEFKRMCKGTACKDCEIQKNAGNKFHVCLDYVSTCYQEAAKIVQKWSDSHPKKTRQSKFLKLYPNAKLHFDGSLVINPCELDEAFKSEYCNSDNCHKCRAEYWLAEVE